MAPKLYKMDLSPPVRAVMMTAEILGVKLQEEEIDLLTGQHMTPEYLKKNPLHSIPVLEDGDFILHDSHAILTYLVAAYGKDDKLYPKDVKQRALVDQILFFEACILFPRSRNVTYSVVFEGLTKMTEKHIKDIDEAYQFLEAFLSRTTWLAADHMTLADISAVSTVSSTVYFAPLDAAKYPKTAKWLSILQKQSFYQSKNAPGAEILGNFVKNKMA